MVVGSDVRSIAYGDRLNDHSMCDQIEMIESDLWEGWPGIVY